MGKFRKTETVSIGGFDLIKMGTLRKFEEEWVEQYFAKQSDLVSLPALQFAQHLVDCESMTEIQASEEISRLDELGQTGIMAFLLKYKKTIPGIINALIEAPKLKAKGSTEVACFVLQSRLPQGYLQENRTDLMEDLGIDVSGMDEWDTAWMNELGIDVIQSLYEFFMRERLGWQSVAIEVMGEVAESVEPPLGEESPQSKTGSPPIGEGDGLQLRPLELPIESSIGRTLTIAQSA